MTDHQPKRPELIVALVCPLGARVDVLENAICDELASYGYDCKKIKLSSLLENLTYWQPEVDSTEKCRIRHRQEYAFKFRRTSTADALARAAIAAIREYRRTDTENPDTPVDARAYILNQLKHPEEVKLLRKVYGQSVVVIAGHAREETRVQALAERMASRQGRSTSREFESEARELIYIDEKENHPSDEDAKFGQSTRDAYPLSDFFVDLELGNADAVKRFIRLVFGHPFETPTPEEMAMHQASAMALRSSDERRQVGAVVVARTRRSPSNILDADIVASGMNDVPRRQGGSYWNDESPDGRDQALRQRNQGRDLEDAIKSDALGEILVRLKRINWLAPQYAELDDAELSARSTTLLPSLKRTQFTDISEFMRQVHAEMAALVDAAKRGVSVRSAEMYVTSFPCHNCAKHIIAAGIVKVVYLEPYPKSRANMLHRDEIELDPVDPTSTKDKVLFVPFTGVAPRQYPRLFSMSFRGSKNGVSLADWHNQRLALFPQHISPNDAKAYTQSERDALEQLGNEYKWDRVALCPTLS